MSDTIRWRATVYYRSANGTTDVTYDLCELDELQERVERGPHWDCIESIKIERAELLEGALTLEEAAKL